MFFSKKVKGESDSCCCCFKPALYLAEPILDTRHMKHKLMLNPHYRIWIRTSLPSLSDVFYIQCGYNFCFCKQRMHTPYKCCLVKQLKQQENIWLTSEICKCMQILISTRRPVTVLSLLLTNQSVQLWHVPVEVAMRPFPSRSVSISRRPLSTQLWKNCEEFFRKGSMSASEYFFLYSYSSARPWEGRVTMYYYNCCIYYSSVPCSLSCRRGHSPPWCSPLSQSS